MTEKKYMQMFVKNSWPLWLGGFIIGAVVGTIAANNLKPSYDGSVSFRVTRDQTVSQADANYYLYDGYYGEQSALAARSNLASWIKSPRTITDVYTQAGVDLGDKSVEALGETFQVDDDEAAVLNVSFRDGDSDSAQKIGESLVNIVKSGYKVSDVSITPSAPLIAKVMPSKTLALGGITIAITALAFALSLLIHYFRNDNN